MNLEFFIKLREMVSGGLVKMADTARKAASAIRGSNDTLSQSYDTIKRKVSELEGVISKSTSVRQIREARRELEQLNRLAGKHPGSLSAAGIGGGGGLLRGLLPALGIAGGMALGGSILGSGLQAQARAVSFEVMAGEKEGGQLNKDLTKFAQDSIFGTEVYQNAQTMLGFGASVKEVMQDLKMLGDISMGDKDKLGRLTLAFSQVRAAGKLMGQDLLQFVNAGFNPLQIMSQKTGKSIGDLRKMVEEGEISFEMVKDAFVTATSAGGRFHDMTNRIAQTDFGKMEAFKGQMAGLSMQIGGILAPVLGNLITNYLAPFVTWLGEAVVWMQQNWSWLGLIVTALGTAIAVYKAVIFLIQLWKVAQIALNIAMTANPIGIVIAAIAALVAGIMYAWNNFEGFRRVILGLWEVFKTVFTNIGVFFKQIFSPISDALAAFKEGRYLDVAKAVGKLAYNLSPVGLITNAVQFQKEGGFTKGVSDAWEKGKELAKRETSTDPEKLGGDSLASAPVMSKAGEADETVKGIASGGPRVINITIGKMVEKIEVHSANIQEGLDDIEKQVQEHFLRLLYSGAKVQ